LISFYHKNRKLQYQTPNFFEKFLFFFSKGLDFLQKM